MGSRTCSKHSTAQSARQGEWPGCSVRHGRAARGSGRAGPSRATTCAWSGTLPAVQHRPGPGCSWQESGRLPHPAAPNPVSPLGCCTLPHTQPPPPPPQKTKTLLTDRNLASRATPMAISSGSSSEMATATASNTMACTALFLFTFLTGSEPAGGVAGGQVSSWLWARTTTRPCPDKTAPFTSCGANGVPLPAAPEKAPIPSSTAERVPPAAATARSMQSVPPLPPSHLPEYA